MLHGSEGGVEWGSWGGIGKEKRTDIQTYKQMKIHTDTSIHSHFYTPIICGRERAKHVKPKRRDGEWCYIVLSGWLSSFQVRAFSVSSVRREGALQNTTKKLLIIYAVLLDLIEGS